MTNVRPISGLLFLTALISLFLYINSPFAAIKEIASLSLFFLIAAVLFLVIATQTPAIQSLTVKSPREFFAEFSFGLLLGILTASALNLFLVVGEGVRNMTRSIAPLAIQQMGSLQILTIIALLPFLETVILVGGTVVLASFFKNFLPFPKIIAGLLTALWFASFHFSALAGGAWEFSLRGFGAFVMSPQGALPALVMGLLWVTAFLIWNSYTLIFAAHVTVNTIAMAGTLGWGEQTIFLTTMLLVGIVALTYWKIPNLFWQKANDIKLSRLSG